MHLIEVLTTQGFSGAADKRALFNLIGELHTSRGCFSIVTYERPFRNQRLAKRLLILFEKDTYVGMYDIAETPIEIERNAIIFKIDPDLGDRILFDEAGPPAKVRLDGLILDLFK